jgi:pentatricopeptide repeat protein
VPAAAKDDSVRKRIGELNRLTGNDPIDGAFNELFKDKKEARKVLKQAKAMVQARSQEKDTPPPFTYYAALILAQVADEFKDLEAGEAFYRVSIEHATKLISTRKLSQSYLGLIGLYYDNQKYKESVKICKEFLELKTDDGKARIYEVAGTDALGRDGFMERESYDPIRLSKPGVHRLMIQGLAKQGRFDDANKLVDNLIKSRPDDWLNLQLKGWVYREAGRYRQAAKIYEDVIARVKDDKELEEKEKDPFLERYRYILSNIYVEMKDIDKAADNLKALLAKNPDDPTFNNDLGYIWADNNKNLEEAEKFIRKALELDRKKRKKANPDLKPEEDRDNGAYLDSLGWVLFKQKKYEEAKKVLLKAVEDKTNQHIEIYDHLGDVYLALNEKDKAIDAWKKGIRFITSNKRDQERKALVEKKIKEQK